MNTKIDWGQAGSNAQASFDQKVQDAAGDIVQGIDDLMEDGSVPRQVKLQVLQQLGLTLSNRQQLQQLLSGQSVTSSSPSALGGGSSSGSSNSSGISQQDYDDMKDERDAADAQIRDVHSKDRKVLEQIAHDLGMTTPANSNTPFPQDFAKRVGQEIKDRETAATQSASGIDEGKVRKALNAAKTAVDGQKVSGIVKTQIDGKDDVKSKIDDIAKAVGLTPATP